MRNSRIRPHPLDDIRIEIAVVEGVTGTPCRKTDEADRIAVGFELWYEPTPNTMLVADASVSTIGASYNARAALGWRVFERYYLGPEVQGFAAGDNYRQVRAGVHVTGFKTKAIEWSAGLGWANDSDDRDGLYGRLALLLGH